MDIDDLVLPLDHGYGPGGEDLSFSAEYDEIQAARRFDDPSLSQGEWVTEIKEADWGSVVRICTDLLKRRSKDLRVAAWLTEARCKQDGLAGLAEGYGLMVRLSERFWPELHPLPEDGDLEQRAGVLDWLVNQTARLLREAPLTRSGKGEFSLIDLESARTLANQIQRNANLAEELTRNARVTLEAFDAAVKDTPRSHFAAGWRNAQQLKSAVTALQTLLDAHMGNLAPAFGPSYEALDDLERFFAKQGGGEATTAPDALDSPSSDSLAPGTSSPLGETGGPIRSRDQAIAQLQEIAAFFRRTEPHSPVAYLAEKAAHWGNMSLHEWLRSVVKDDGALARVQELLGVDSASDGQA